MNEEARGPGDSLYSIPPGAPARESDRARPPREGVDGRVPLGGRGRLSGWAGAWACMSLISRNT